MSKRDAFLIAGGTIAAIVIAAALFLFSKPPAPQVIGNTSISTTITVVSTIQQPTGYFGGGPGNTYLSMAEVGALFNSTGTPISGEIGSLSTSADGTLAKQVNATVNNLKRNGVDEGFLIGNVTSYTVLTFYGNVSTQGVFLREMIWKSSNAADVYAGLLNVSMYDHPANLNYYHMQTINASVNGLVYSFGTNVTAAKGTSPNETISSTEELLGYKNGTVVHVYIIMPLNHTLVSEATLAGAIAGDIP